MKRRDHHPSPMAPRWLLALIPPSTGIGPADSYSHQRFMLFFPLAPGSPTARSRRNRLGRQDERLAQGGGGQPGEPALAGADDLLGQCLLLLDHRVDPLLQGADADELAYLDVAALPDAERPVVGRGLYRGLPPPVDGDDGGRRGQVEPGAARL